MVLQCTYLSRLCEALCSTAYVNVERAPICHWAACTSAKQYLVSGFNYRFARVCIYMWLMKVEVFCSPSYPSAASLALALSPLSFFLARFILCTLVTCNVECLTLLNTLNILSLPVVGKKKAFSLPCLSHVGPFNVLFFLFLPSRT